MSERRRGSAGLLALLFFANILEVVRRSYEYDYIVYNAKIHQSKQTVSFHDIHRT